MRGEICPKMEFNPPLLFPLQLGTEKYTHFMLEEAYV